MTTFDIICRDRLHDQPHHITTLTHFMGEWSSTVPICDMETRPRNPLAGWKFRCRACAYYVSVSKESLHPVLQTLALHRHYELSIQGLHTLHHTPGAGLEKPQPQQREEKTIGT